MKNRAILLLLGLIISTSFAFGQVPKDTLKKDSIHPPTPPHLPDIPHFKSYFSFDKSWQLSKEAYKKQLEAMDLSEKEIDKRMKEFENQKIIITKRIKSQMKTVEKQMQLYEVQRKNAEKQLQQFDKKWKSIKFQKRMADVQRELAEKQKVMALKWRSSVHNLTNEHIIMSGKDSKTKAIKLNVTESSTLIFNVSGSVNSGNVLIAIYNPKGQKQGELSLEHRKGSTSETNMFSGSTSGSLNKIINAPETGEWVVKIKPKKSKGNINISVSQFTKPKN